MFHAAPPSTEVARRRAAHRRYRADRRALISADRRLAVGSPRRPTGRGERRTGIDLCLVGAQRSGGVPDGCFCPPSNLQKTPRPATHSAVGRVYPATDSGSQ